MKKTNTQISISEGNLHGKSRKKNNVENKIFLKNYKLKNSQNAELFSEYKLQTKNGVKLKKIYKLNKLGKYGLVDENGNHLTKFIYGDITVFDEQSGVYKTYIGRKCGLINYNGNILLPAKFEDIKNTQNSDVVIVKNSKYYGLFDYQTSSFVASPIYHNIDQTNQYNWILNSNKLFGHAYSKNGTSRVINPKYENIVLYKNVYKTYNDNKEGLISDNGKIITEPAYDSIELINEYDSAEKNLMLFKTRIDNRYGIVYYSPYELTIVSPIYADVQYKGLVNVLSDGYWRILDNHGNVITR
ncbi:WG repeat-containing protein [bacterium]|nr:WG repeat-containing protein [bacterium]